MTDQSSPVSRPVAAALMALPLALVVAAMLWGDRLFDSPQTVTAQARWLAWPALAVGLGVMALGFRSHKTTAPGNR